MHLVWLVWNDLNDEFKVFDDESVYNRYVATEYGHVEGQVTHIVLPKHIHVMQVPKFTMETVNYAFAH